MGFRQRNSWSRFVKQDKVKQNDNFQMKRKNISGDGRTLSRNSQWYQQVQDDVYIYVDSLPGCELNHVFYFRNTWYTLKRMGTIFNMNLTTTTICFFSSRKYIFHLTISMHTSIWTYNLKYLNIFNIHSTK